MGEPQSSRAPGVRDSAMIPPDLQRIRATRGGNALQWPAIMRARTAFAVTVLSLSVMTAGAAGWRAMSGEPSPLSGAISRQETRYDSFFAPGTFGPEPASIVCGPGKPCPAGYGCAWNTDGIHRCVPNGLPLPRPCDNGDICGAGATCQNIPTAPYYACTKAQQQSACGSGYVQCPSGGTCIDTDTPPYYACKHTPGMCFYLCALGVPFGCTCGAPPVCGNGKLEDGEQCDNGAHNCDTCGDSTCTTGCRKRDPCLTAQADTGGGMRAQIGGAAAQGGASSAPCKKETDMGPCCFPGAGCAGATRAQCGLLGTKFYEPGPVADALCRATCFAGTTGSSASSSPYDNGSCCVGSLINGEKAYGCYPKLRQACGYVPWYQQTAVFFADKDYQNPAGSCKSYCDDLARSAGLSVSSAPSSSIGSSASAASSSKPAGYRCNPATEDPSTAPTCTAASAPSYAYDPAFFPTHDACKTACRKEIYCMQDKPDNSFLSPHFPVCVKRVLTTDTPESCPAPYASYSACTAALPPLVGYCEADGPTRACFPVFNKAQLDLCAGNMLSSTIDKPLRAPYYGYEPHLAQCTKGKKPEPEKKYVCCENDDAASPPSCVQDCAVDPEALPAGTVEYDANDPAAAAAAMVSCRASCKAPEGGRCDFFQAPSQCPAGTECAFQGSYVQGGNYRCIRK